MLEFWLVWRTQRIADGERYEESPGRSDLLGHFAQERQTYGGDATFFYDARDQSDGLVAHRSDRYEEYCVHLILPQLSCNLRSGLRDQPLRSRDRPMRLKCRWFREPTSRLGESLVKTLSALQIITVDLLPLLSIR